MINQTNFSDTSIIKYLSNSNYHNICDVFIDYINKDDLDQAIESFDAILGDIEMGGEVKKGKLKIVSNFQISFLFSND